MFKDCKFDVPKFSNEKIAFSRVIPWKFEQREHELYIVNIGFIKIVVKGIYFCQLKWFPDNLMNLKHITAHM